jgi:hypothetical protein
MQLHRALGVVLTVCVVAPESACTSDPSGVEAPPGLVTRRDPEPAGANCPAGGTAVRVGSDLDRDGVLDDDEVAHTDYVCAGTTPATLLRKDPIAPGDVCAAGGVTVHSGVDDNGDGVLEDGEIDQSTTVCDVDDIWEGDFSGDLSDPAIAARFAAVRVVTGSVSIQSDADVALPALEVIGGGLSLDGKMAALDLPALRTIGGDVTVDVPGIDAFTLPAVQTIGGELFITGNGVHGESIAAPALRSIGGRLVLFWGAEGALDLPTLQTIGGSLVLEGSLTSLGLDQLASVGGDLHFDDLQLTALQLPAVRTIAGKLEVYGSDKLATIELPALEQLGELHLSGPKGLRSVRLPALTTIHGKLGVYDAIALDTLVLTQLAHVDASVVILDAPALHGMDVSSLATVGLEPLGDYPISIELADAGFDALSFPSLVSAGDVTIETDPNLRTVSLPLLRTATALDFGASPLLTSVSAPRVTRLSYINVTEVPALTTFDVSALTTIDRHLDFRDNNVADLSGFRSLRSVASLYLSRLKRLQDLRGLTSLEDVGRIELYYDQTLTSLAGLEHVRQLEQGLLIQSDAAQIKDLRGLDNLAYAGLDVTVNLAALESLTGLESLTTVDGGLTIGWAKKVTSLTPLDHLTKVTGDIDLDDTGVPDDQIAALKQRVKH